MDFGSLSDSPELGLVGGAAGLVADLFGNVSTIFGIADYFTGDFQEAAANGFMK